MSKTTPKKTKKSPTRAINKKVVAQKVTKPVTKKEVVKPAVVKKAAVKGTSKVTESIAKLNAVFKKLASNKKNMIILVAALLFLGAGYLLKDVFIVAMVNGKPVYRWSVVQRLEDQGGKQILDSLITEALVKQAIKDSGVKVEQAEIDAAVSEIEGRIAAQGMTLDQALKDQGMTKDQLIEDIVMQKSAEKIVGDKVQVTDEEVAAYIEENKQYFPEGSDLESMKDLVKSQLKSSKVSTEIQTWVQSLQDNAKIIYLKNYKTSL